MNQNEKVLLSLRLLVACLLCLVIWYVGVYRPWQQALQEQEQAQAAMTQEVTPEQAQSMEAQKQQLAQEPLDVQLDRAAKASFDKKKEGALIYEGDHLTTDVLVDMCRTHVWDGFGYVYCPKDDTLARMSWHGIILISRPLHHEMTGVFPSVGYSPVPEGQAEWDEHVGLTVAVGESAICVLRMDGTVVASQPCEYDPEAAFVEFGNEFAYGEGGYPNLAYGGAGGVIYKVSLKDGTIEPSIDGFVRRKGNYYELSDGSVINGRGEAISAAQ